MTKVLLVGKGYWGKNWYRTLMDCQVQFQVADVNTPDQVDQNGICYYDNIDKVDKSHLTHAIISTPSETHVEVFEKLKEFIKPNHILIEKPCGHTVEQSRKLKGCFPGYLQLYSPAYSYIKSNIDLIGKPHFYKSIRASMGPRIRSAGTIVEDYLVHDLYLFLDLFEPNRNIEIVRRVFTNRFKTTGPDTVFLSLFNKDSEVIADMFSSWWYPLKERRIVITGNKGSFIWINDELYFNSSRYEEIPGQKDSFGNVGYKLETALDEKIELSNKSVLEYELEHFLSSRTRLNDIVKIWELIEDIKTYENYTL